MTLWRHPGESRDPREARCHAWIPASAGMTLRGDSRGKVTFAQCEPC
jgi:hypothetical protein